MISGGKDCSSVRKGLGDTVAAYYRQLLQRNDDKKQMSDGQMRPAEQSDQFKLIANKSTPSLCDADLRSTTGVSRHYIAQAARGGPKIVQGIPVVDYWNAANLVKGDAVVVVADPADPKLNDRLSALRARYRGYQLFLAEKTKDTRPASIVVMFMKLKVEKKKITDLGKFAAIVFKDGRYKERVMNLIDYWNAPNLVKGDAVVVVADPADPQLDEKERALRKRYDRHNFFMVEKTKDTRPASIVVTFMKLGVNKSLLADMEPVDGIVFERGVCVGRARLPVKETPEEMARKEEERKRAEEKRRSEEAKKTEEARKASEEAYRKRVREARISLNEADKIVRKALKKAKIAERYAASAKRRLKKKKFEKARRIAAEAESTATEAINMAYQASKKTEKAEGIKELRGRITKIVGQARKADGMAGDASTAAREIREKAIEGIEAKATEERMRAEAEAERRAERERRAREAEQKRRAEVQARLRAKEAKRMYAEIVAKAAEVERLAQEAEKWTQEANKMWEEAQKIAVEAKKLEKTREMAEGAERMAATAIMNAIVARNMAKEAKERAQEVKRVAEKEERLEEAKRKIGEAEKKAQVAQEKALEVKELAAGAKRMAEEALKAKEAEEVRMLAEAEKRADETEKKAANVKTKAQEIMQKVAKIKEVEKAKKKVMEVERKVEEARNAATASWKKAAKASKKIKGAAKMAAEAEREVRRAEGLAAMAEKLANEALNIIAEEIKKAKAKKERRRKLGAALELTSDNYLSKWSSPMRILVAHDFTDDALWKTLNRIWEPGTPPFVEAHSGEGKKEHARLAIIDLSHPQGRRMAHMIGIPYLAPMMRFEEWMVRGGIRGGLLSGTKERLWGKVQGEPGKVYKILVDTYRYGWEVDGYGFSFVDKTNFKHHFEDNKKEAIVVVADPDASRKGTKKKYGLGAALAESLAEERRQLKHDVRYIWIPYPSLDRVGRKQIRGTKKYRRWLNNVLLKDLGIKGEGVWRIRHDGKSWHAKEHRPAGFATIATSLEAFYYLQRCSDRALLVIGSEQGPGSEQTRELRGDLIKSQAGDGFRIEGKYVDRLVFLPLRAIDKVYKPKDKFLASVKNKQSVPQAYLYVGPSGGRGRIDVKLGELPTKVKPVKLEKKEVAKPAYEPPKLEEPRTSAPIDFKRKILRRTAKEFIGSLKYWLGLKKVMRKSVLQRKFIVIYGNINDKQVIKWLQDATRAPDLEEYIYFIDTSKKSDFPRYPLIKAGDFDSERGVLYCEFNSSEEWECSDYTFPR